MEHLVGLISHFAGGFLYMALVGIMLWPLKSKPLPEKPILIAVTTTGIWGIVTACIFLLPQHTQHSQLLTLSQSFEALRNCFWLIALSGLLRPITTDAKSPIRRWLRFGFILIAIQTLIVLLQWFTTQNHPIFWWNHKALAFSLLLTAITFLVLIEQVIRNADPAEVWHIKFFCLGLGALYSYDFLLYSYTVLSNELQNNWWQARGAVYSLVIPLFYISFSRRKYRNQTLALSHKIVFHTSILLIASLYLILMALAGYYFKLFGGSWGQFLQILFLASSTIFLFCLLFSGKVRAKVSIFLNRHFLPYQYDYREQWLEVTHSLSDAIDLWQMSHQIIKLLANCVESTGGALWYKNEKDQYELAYNTIFSLPKIMPSCDFLQLVQYWQTSDRVLNLHEQSEHSNNHLPTLPNWLTKNDNAWLLIPLPVHNRLSGFVILAKPRAKLQLNWENYDFIKTVARQGAGHLYLATASEQLARAQRFDAVHQMSAFFVHDLKTIISQLSMLTQNAHKHLDNPHFIQDMIQTIEHTITKMQRILGHLKAPETQLKTEIIDLKPLLTELISELKHKQPIPQFSNEEIPQAFTQGNRQELKTAFLNLIINAQEAAHINGTVTITLKQYNQSSNLITITDSGHGMSSEFIQTQLFKPFYSTKGLTGMGLGMFQAKQYIQHCNGELFVESLENQGTVFSILLPSSPPNKHLQESST